jgi:hypothetical protein
VGVKKKQVHTKKCWAYQLRAFTITHCILEKIEII